MKTSIVAIILSLPMALFAASPSGQEKYQNDIQERQTKAASALDQLMKGVSSLEIFTLDAASGWDKDEQLKQDSSPRLQKWKITQRASVETPKEVALLREGLKRSILTSNGTVAACFEPRHGLRFSKGGQQISVIVCFECLQMEVVGAPGFDGATITSAAARAFYSVLRAHGLTKPSRIGSLSDSDIAGQLIGTWKTEGRVRSDSRGGQVHSVGQKTYAIDGGFAFEEEFFLYYDGGPETKYAGARGTGRWKVEDGFLVTYDLKQSRGGSEENVDRDLLREDCVAVISISEREASFTHVESTSGGEFVLRRSR